MGLSYFIWLLIFHQTNYVFAQQKLGKNTLYFEKR